MAFGTPVVGTTAYSASGGTSVAPSYPASIVATDQLVLIIGQKPSTANSGSVTTPTGWTLRESLTAAGGYGATLGADTGNTNLYIYTKDVVTAGLSGTVSVTVATNNVCWANITRVPTGGGTISYGSADGQRTTTPTSPLSVALTDGSPATAFAAGDFAIWAMCIPTDVTTPAQFSAHTITSSGITFNATAELIEPDSTTGNDIGGYVAYVTVSTGTGGGAPTVGATLAGTLTNVRGPIALLRMREANAYTLTAQTGSYSVSGVSAGVNHNRLLSASAGSYSLSGVDAIITKGSALNNYVLTAQAGSYSKTGVSASINRGRVLTVSAGSYSLSGVNANLYRNRALTSSAGAYSVSGVSANITYTPAAVNYTLTAQAGSYTLAGVSASISKNRVLTASAGNFSVSGVNAGLNVGKVLTASAGSYAITGQNATITRTGGAVDYKITAQAGSYLIGADFWDDGYAEPGYAGNAVITIGQRPRGASKPKITPKQAKKPILNDDEEVFEILSMILEEIS